MVSNVIIIPARFGSTRFPGKPLAMLNGKPILAHVYDHAVIASQSAGADIYVTTDDRRISSYCEGASIPVVMTSQNCKTGTDRVHSALEILDRNYDFVLNLQGDAPFCYPDFIQKILESFDNASDIVTPVTQLGWDDLDALREAKKQTPFSGTTTVMDEQGYCRWFSKNIIPAIRKEEELREQSDLSPVYRHIGLYGYAVEALERYVSFEETIYEKLEGLEQLRALENGLCIKGVKVSYDGRPSMSGIDSPEDLARAEKLIAELS